MSLSTLNSGKNLFAAFGWYEKLLFGLIIVFTILTLSIVWGHYIDDFCRDNRFPYFKIDWIPDNRILGEAVRTFGQIIVGAGVLVTFLINIANVRVKYNSDLIENSYKIIDKWDTSPVENARKFTRDLRENKTLTEQDVYSLIIEGKIPLADEGSAKIDFSGELWKGLGVNFDNKDERYNALRRQEFRRQLLVMFNFWIGIALSINKKRVDEELILDALGFKFVEMFKRFDNNFITKEYKEKGNPNYEILETMHKKWKEILDKRKEVYTQKLTEK